MMWGAKMLTGLKREPSPPDLTKRLKIWLLTAARSGERTTTLNTAPSTPMVRATEACLGSAIERRPCCA